MSSHSPDYDPQGNGNAEIGVQIVKSMFRTHRSVLGDDLVYRVPAGHPLKAWLVRHTGNVVTWSIKGPDELTAYQRFRLKPFGTRLFRFGKSADTRQWRMNHCHRRATEDDFM